MTKLKEILGTWAERTRLIGELKKDYMKKLGNFINTRRKEAEIYPPEGSIFTAFKFTPFENVKVVILGQDVYHTPEVAEGLAFSSGKPGYLPPSLRNIFKEIKNDTGKQSRLEAVQNYSLAFWALQGVFLINTILTVEKGKPGSHKNKGWEDFVSVAFRELLENRKHIVYMVWGNYAKEFMKNKVFDRLNDPDYARENNAFLLTAHPSPLSANKGFYGNNHFTRCNQYLISHGKQDIKW